MLVLGRREFEKVVVATPVGVLIVEIMRIDGDQVKIGFDAPAAFTIDREEVFRAKHRNPDPPRRGGLEATAREG